MDTTITLGQLLIASLAIIGAGLLFWKNSDVEQAKIKAQHIAHKELVEREFETQKAAITELKKEVGADRESFRKTLDVLVTGMNEIKVMLEKKADKEHSSHSHQR